MPVPHRIDFSIEAELLRRDAVRLALRGEVDLAAVGPLHEAVLVQSDARRDVVLDLGGVHFIDPCGIGALVRERRDAQLRGHSVCVAPGASPVVLRLADLTSTVALLGLSA